MPQQAVIYTRFSPRRTVKGCESLETQLDYCTNYCLFHDLEIIGTYEDPALSGMDTNRPGLQAALSQVYRTKCVLVVYALDRLSRSLKDTIAIIDDIKKYKASLCAVQDKIDTTTSMGVMFFKIAAIFAEFMREKAAQNTSDHMRRHQAMGRNMSGQCPYGCQDHPHLKGRMVQEPKEQENIKIIVQLRDTGLSLGKIAEELNARRIKPRRKRMKVDGKMTSCGKLWNRDALRGILRRAEFEKTFCPNESIPLMPDD